MYRVWLVDRARWPCTDIRSGKMDLDGVVALALGRLIVLGLLILDGNGRRSLSIVAVLSRLHVRGNAVHVRRWCKRLLCGKRHLGRAGRGLDVEVKVVMAKGLRGPRVDEGVAEVDARRRIHGQHEAGWMGSVCEELSEADGCHEQKVLRKVKTRLLHNPGKVRQQQQGTVEARAIQMGGGGEAWTVKQGATGVSVRAGQVCRVIGRRYDSKESRRRRQRRPKR